MKQIFEILCENQSKDFHVLKQENNMKNYMQPQDRSMKNIIKINKNCMHTDACKRRLVLTHAQLN